MHVIDLLNKIANGEKVPLKIKLLCPTLKDEYRNCTWNGSWYEYDVDNTDVVFTTDKLELNDEIEIIEEDKKLEKLKNINCEHCIEDCYYEPLTKEEIALDISTLKKWVNKIIDYLEEKE